MIRLPHIVYETTQACNLDCRYCYNVFKGPNGHTAARSSYSLSLKTLKKLYALAEIDSISFTGGEPFMSERLAELVLFCRMKRSHVSIITNGSLCTHENLRTLLSMGGVSFQFPVHSADPLIHDRITRTPGSWEKSVKALREVIELDERPTAVIVLTKINCHVLPELFEFLLENRVVIIMMLRFNIGGAGLTDTAELVPSRKELYNAYKQADAFAAEEGIILTSNIGIPRCILDTDEFSHIMFHGCSYDISSMPVTLDPEGNFRVCNHSPVIIGNIHRDGLAPLQGHSFDRWKIIPEKCAECSMYEKCRGGCRAAAEQYYGDGGMEDPFINFSR